MTPDELHDAVHDRESFLGAALYYFMPRPLDPPETEPNWRMFADFLCFGKIIEWLSHARGKQRVRITSPPPGGPS